MLVNAVVIVQILKRQQNGDIHQQVGISRIRAMHLQGSG